MNHNFLVLLTALPYARDVLPAEPNDGSAFDGRRDTYCNAILVVLAELAVDASAEQHGRIDHDEYPKRGEPEDAGAEYRISIALRQ